DTNSFGTQSSSTDEFLVDATSTAGGGSAIAYLTPATGSQELTVLRFVGSAGLPASNPIVVGPHTNESQFDAAIDHVFNGNVAVAYENFNLTSFDRDIRLHIFT